MSSVSRSPIVTDAVAAAAAVDASQALAQQGKLFADLRRIDSVLVEVSGGADSGYPAWAAQQALGERALAITALSASFSRHDREQAEAFIAARGLRHEFIETRELENPQ